MDGKSSADEEEISLIRPIILSTMPVDRAEVLRILVLKCGLSATELSKEIRKSSKTIRRTLKELEALENQPPRSKLTRYEVVKPRPRTESVGRGESFDNFDLVF